MNGIRRIRRMRDIIENGGMNCVEFDFSELFEVLERILSTHSSESSMVARNRPLKNEKEGRFQIPEENVEKEKEKEKESVSPKIPPSIFDIQCDGKFEDFFKQLFPSAIVNGKRNQEVNNPPAKNDPDEMPLKDAFVFIANRLTFLVKTRYPIIWDTSTMEMIGDDIAFIALDEEKNPRIDLKNATEIAMAVNDDEMIQNEIEDYFKDTKWKSIYCAPFNMDVKGKCRLGFVFYVRLREDD